MVNLVRPRDLGAEDARRRAHGHSSTARAIAADLSAAGVDVDGRRCVDGLLDRGPRPRRAAGARGRAARRWSASSDVPTYELPRLAGGIDLGGLYELAGGLRDQGLA